MVHDTLHRFHDQCIFLKWLCNTGTTLKYKGSDKLVPSVLPSAHLWIERNTKMCLISCVLLNFISFMWLWKIQKYYKLVM